MGQAAANFTGDIVGGIFGDANRPGVFGTGQERFNNKPQMGQPKRDANGNPVIGEPVKHPGESDSDFNHRREDYLFNGTGGDIVYETDPYKTWQDPMADKRRGELYADKAKYEGRKLEGDARVDRGDIVQTSGVSLAPTEGFQQGQGAQVGQYERARAAQLAAAERSGNVNIGQANTYGGAQVDPAAQARAAQLGRQDAQFRAGQTQLMGQLQEQAAGRGPSLAAGQLQEASDRTLAQQQGAAAAAGGNAALARRQLATNAGQQNQQTARDVAQTRMQEQMAARQQLQGVAAGGRSQDIEVANAQAQLQQSANLANQAAINTRAGQQAGLTQGANLASMDALNQRQYQQAQMQMQNQQFNAGQGNQFALQQGQFNQSANLANMEQQNQRQALQAQLYQQGGMQTQNLMQQQKLQEGAWAQQAGMANQQYMNQVLFANQQAAMQNQQMNDQMARYMTEAGLGLDARQQQAMMAYQKQEQETALGYAGLEQKAYEGAREGQGGMMSGIGSMLGAMSDEEVKDSVTRGGGDVGNFLDQYGENKYTAIGMQQSSDKKASTGMFGGMASGAAMAGGASGGGMAAMSDDKAKDLSNENSKLKAQMVGMSMQNMGGQGASSKQGFFGGYAQGMKAKNQADAIQAANTPAAKSTPKTDPSSTMSPVMNNPNMAIAVPGGSAGAAQMSPSYGGLGVRENPYGASAPQTWGGQMTPPSMGTQGISTDYPTGGYAPTATPQEIMSGNPSSWQPGYAAPMQTWGVPQGMSSSPIGAKTGVSSGNMQISNFLDSVKGAGSKSSEPTNYGGGMASSGGSNPTGYGDTGLSSYSDENAKNIKDDSKDKSDEKSDSKARIGYKPPKWLTDALSFKNSGQKQMDKESDVLTSSYHSSNKPTKDTSLEPVMNNPNMAIAVPRGTAKQFTPEYPQTVGPIENGIVRQDPYSSSDRNTKEHIGQVLDNKLAQFLDQVHPYEYSYKEPELPGRGYGRYVSPMAQELERTDLGKSAVKETPQGKMVDYGKLGGVMLAAQAQLNERVNALEGKKTPPPMKGKK